MFIFMLLKCGIYHNAIIIIPLINISKNVSIHESMFKSFVLFFFFASLCKYSLDIKYVNVQNLLPKRNLQKCALLPLYPVPLFFRMPANGTNQCFQRRIQGCYSIQDGALCNNSQRLPAVNYYHKALQPGCCSNPRSASGYSSIIKGSKIFCVDIRKLAPNYNF